MSESPEAKKRRTAARPTISVRPLFVSQETAFVVLGITPRKFLDLVVPMCRDSVVRIGKSALIPADVAEGRLLALAARGASANPTTATARGDGDGDGDGKNDDGEGAQTVDEILRRLGRQRTP